MRSTILDSKPYDKKAAAEILISPASAVASKIDDSVESILFSSNTVAPLREATSVEARYFTCDAQDIARIMISGWSLGEGYNAANDQTPRASKAGRNRSLARLAHKDSAGSTARRCNTASDQIPQATKACRNRSLARRADEDSTGSTARRGNAASDRLRQALSGLGPNWGQILDPLPAAPSTAPH